MTVVEDVGRIAGAAAAFAEPGEELAGVLVAETLGRRVYLCAFQSAEGRAWLALGAAGEPLTDGRLVRDAASLAALCEVAEESAGGGHLSELQARLAELRETDNPEGIEEAEAAAASLAETLQPEPRVASGALSRCARLRLAAARAGARRERCLSLRGGDAGGARLRRGACGRRRKQLQDCAGVSGELEKRASDAEREQAIARLREASAEGRLTFEELADRAALAYRAQSHADLARLTDDLPAPAAPSSRRKPVRWSVVVIGELKRAGRWRIARRTTVVMGIGDCELDLRQAELDGEEVTVHRRAADRRHDARRARARRGRALRPSAAR